MLRPSAQFLSHGLRHRSHGSARGVLLALALAAAGPAAAQTPPSDPVTQAALQSDRTRELARMLRARPADLFVKFAKAAATPGAQADRSRMAAASLARLLMAQADAGGEEIKAEIADLMERGARGAFARGYKLPLVLDVATSLDPMGELLPEDRRSPLWRELSGRPNRMADPPKLGPPPETRPAIEKPRDRDT